MSRLLALLLTLALAPSLPAADWPQLLGPARDGHSAETKLNWEWPKDGPPVAWKKDVGKGWAGPVEYFSPPFVRGGLLQGWSSLPAAVAPAFADQVLAGDPEDAR